MLCLKGVGEDAKKKLLFHTTLLFIEDSALFSADYSAAARLAFIRSVEKSVEFDRQDFCETCSGSGSEPGSKRRNCPTCGGYGQVEQSTGLGAFFGSWTVHHTRY